MINIDDLVEQETQRGALRLDHLKMSLKSAIMKVGKKVDLGSWQNELNGSKRHTANSFIELVNTRLERHSKHKIKANDQEIIENMLLKIPEYGDLIFEDLQFASMGTMGIEIFSSAAVGGAAGSGAGSVIPVLGTVAGLFTGLTIGLRKGISKANITYRDHLSELVASRVERQISHFKKSFQETKEITKPYLF